VLRPNVDCKERGVIPLSFLFNYAWGGNYGFLGVGLLRTIHSTLLKDSVCLIRVVDTNHRYYIYIYIYGV